MRTSALALFMLLAACGGKPVRDAGKDENTGSLGSVEVTARLLEVPEGAVFERDLYHYSTILKYEIVECHRGDLNAGGTIYVGHYDPWKPRSAAADKRAKGIGGDVTVFREGSLHRMALDFPMDDHFMGGIVDKYFGKREGAAYWALWTNSAD